MTFMFLIWEYTVCTPFCFILYNIYIVLLLPYIFLNIVCIVAAVVLMIMLPIQLN